MSASGHTCALIPANSLRLEIRINYAMYKVGQEARLAPASRWRREEESFLFSRER